MWSLRAVAAVAMVLVLGPVLAGCSEPDAAADAAGIELAEVDNSVSRGSISGVVVDEAIRPLAGVNLTLLGPQTPATSDDDGLFVFTDLEPGLYTVSAAPHKSADGRLFLGIQTTAEVRAGETAKVKLVLPPDPTPQPYHVTYKFDWYDEAGVALVDFAVDLFGRGIVPVPFCDQCYFEFTSDANVTQFVVEATWTDSVAPPHKESEYYWTVYALTVGDYASDYFYNPGRAVVEGSAFPGETEWAVNLAAEEEWITLQQKAQLFVTAFYVAPAPDGWSFVAGDT